MKKILLIIMILFLTGCTVVRIDTNSIDNIVDVVLSKDNKLFNRIGKGYKYYIPRSVSYLDTTDYNDILYSNGNYYYLYIDIVSYYNNIKQEYKENDKLYYSKSIELDDNFGYLEVKKHGELYLIQFMYNYSKIETLVEKKDINEAILNSSYILSTVKFNDNIIKIMLEEDFFKNKEEVYDIFTSKAD